MQFENMAKWEALPVNRAPKHGRRDARPTFLAVLVILSVFMTAVAAVFLTLYLQERDAGILTSTRVAELKRQLDAAPKDETLKEQIRLEDLRQVRDYMANRQRFLWGAYLMILALAAWVAVARWYFRARERGGDAGLEAMGEGPDAAELRRRFSDMSAELARLKLRMLERSRRPAEETRRQTLWAVGVVGVSMGCLLLGLGFFGVGESPLEKPALTTPAPPETEPISPTFHPSPGVPSPTGGDQPAYTENWPFFRGPNAGIAAAGDWPTTWSATENRNILWKTPIPVTGKSSPILWGNRLFVTGGDAKNQRVVCLDSETGGILWDSPVEFAQGPAKEIEVFEDTGFAAPTPAADGRRVYALFATGILAAFDYDGKQAWAIDLGTPKSTYGYSSSLLMFQNVLIVQYDQGREAEERLSKLLGVNPADGTFVYQVARPVPNSWSSPILARMPEGAEVVTCAPEWVVAHDPLTGRERWRVKNERGDVAASPAFGGGLVFTSNDGAELLAIRPGGSGDVTASHVVWKSKKGLPDTSSPVCDGTYLLQSAPGGMLTCFDAATGKPHWEEYIDTSAASSFIIAGDLGYLCCIDGSTRIIRVAAAYQPAGRGEVGEPIYATPVFMKGRIYVRGEKNLFCIGRK
jgi:outer membrane protein assembly factor BamB